MNFEHKSPRARHQAIGDRQLPGDGSHERQRKYQERDTDFNFNREDTDHLNHPHNRDGGKERSFNRGGQRNNQNRWRGGRKPLRQARPLFPRVDNKLYFIALLPNAEIGMDIIRLKREFAENYGTSHALKSMPYITVQVPFSADPALERVFCDGLSEFAASQSPFEVQLNGFGTIPHHEKKVLNIQVERTPGMLEMHQKLMYFLRKEFLFSYMLARRSFSPHITMAYNDLTPEVFDKAWIAYEHKPFTASFKVNNLYLMRHNGNSWEVLHKCRLGEAVENNKAAAG
jgi:2'-5' RNA ligase